jgi:hypothetical protein
MTRTTKYVALDVHRADHRTPPRGPRDGIFPVAEARSAARIAPRVAVSCSGGLAALGALQPTAVR